jgi:hypothetical protein
MGEPEFFFTLAKDKFFGYSFQIIPDMIHTIPLLMNGCPGLTMMTAPGGANTKHSKRFGIFMNGRK